MRHIVSVSGGKDSVAAWLLATREGLDPIAVYQDTRWEWSGHYAHLAMLEERIGPIRRVHAAETFAQLVRRKGTFPSRVRRYCTEELKILPCAELLNQIREEVQDDITLIVGIRAEESADRAEMPEREWHSAYDCEVWRPLLRWTVQDVISEHKRAGIPMHPLYYEGAERVGCFPCIGAPKAEIAAVARLMPERIDEIRQLEAEIGQTMFTFDRRAEKARLGDDGPSVTPAPIDDVVVWARTSRGGRQLTLVPQQTGCARWGTCEVRKPEAD